MANSLVASIARAFIPPEIKQRKSASMKDSLRGSARVDNIGTRERQAVAGASSGTISRGWQQQAWSYFDEVGELHYVGSFLGACLSRCKLTVGVADDDGHVGPAFDEEGNPLPGMERAREALNLVRSLKNDIGGQAQLLRAVGLNLTIAGECHLVGNPTVDGGASLANVAELEWEVLSTDEFRPSGKNYVWHRRPGSTPEEIDGESVHVVRIWRSHPRFAELPDCSVKAVMDVLEELVLLTRQVRGETLSRLANGRLLLVPEEIEYSDDENDDASSDAGDAFTRDLIQTMGTAISDKGSAAQTVPFVIRAPAELLHPDKFRDIDLSPKNLGDSAAKRVEAVQRFAQGIDLPVEKVTGHAGTSFANAVVIDDDTFKTHVEPVMEIVCDALTVGYLRPALGDDLPFVVHYDAVELVARPNRSQDAKDVHDRYALSDATLRSATGFSDSDAPDDDELQKRIEIRQLTQARTTIQTTPEQAQAEDKGVGGDGPPIPPTVAPGTPKTPGGDIPQGKNLPSTSDGPLAAAIQAATEVSTERAVRRAGARLRSKAAKEPAVRDQLSQVPDPEVAVTLGPALVARLTQGDDLFFAEFDTLWSWAVRNTGDQNYADSLRDASVAIANERLYQPRRPFPFSQLPKYSERGVISAVTDG